MTTERNPEMKPWNDIAAATADPQTQGPWPDVLRDEWRAVLTFDKDIWDSGAFPLQRRRENETMIRIANKKTPRVIMEIGADKGGGIWQWFMETPAKTIIANEVRGCPYSDLLAARSPNMEFLFSEASSYAPETVREIATFLAGRTIDVLFLDGNKARFDVDFDCYRPLMTPGGIVFMHDIREGPPGRVFAKLAETHITARIIDTTESAEARCRAAAGIEADGYYEGWLREWAGQSAGVGVIYIPE